ncbi:MAG: hypothetical protein EZS28_052841, partial [Streblomastix strix]
LSLKKMFISLFIAFLGLASLNSAHLHKSAHVDNAFVYYVDQNRGWEDECGGDIIHPCKYLDYAITGVHSRQPFIIYVYYGQYDHALKSYLEFDDIPYPTADVIAKQEAQINVRGPIHPIGKIIISFSNFSIDFGDLYFLIDDSESVLKFASCNVFRNGGNTALNTQSLAVVNHGSLILEDFNINGSNLIGNQPLIQSTSPKLIQLTTFTVTNVALVSGNTLPLLLSVTELEQETNIIISDVHVKQNTAGDEAEA